MFKGMYTVLLLVVGYATAYPTGAPKETCTAFTAKHEKHTPKNSAPPYEIIINSPKVASGGTVSVKLQGIDGTKFKGFFVQGVDVNGSPVGEFKPVPGLAQTVECTPSSKAVTHVNPADKISVPLEWQAPASFKGTVYFRAVVVQTYENFWNNLRSGPITVS